MTTLTHTCTAYERDDRTHYRNADKLLADYCVVTKRGNSIVLLMHGDDGKHYEIILDGRAISSLAHYIPQLTQVTEKSPG